MEGVVSRNMKYKAMARNMAGLPIDIVVDILLRLRVEDLIKSTSVCKLWYSLIYHPQFVKLHLNKAQMKTSFLLKANSRFSRPRPNPLFLMENQDADINKAKRIGKLFEPNDIGAGLYAMTDSCHGLVCCTLSFDFQPADTCIYNPATREFVYLPHGTPARCLDIAFAYDHTSSTYKIFRIFQDQDDFSISHYEVLTLGTSSWRRTGTITYYHYRGKHIQSNGAVHWLFLDWTDNLHLVSVNISSETTQTHKFKKGRWKSLFFTPYLVELNENPALCLIDESKMEIWVVKDYERSLWEKRYDIIWTDNLTKIQLRPCPLPIENNEMIMLKGRDLIYFNLLENKSRKVCYRPTGKWRDLDVVPYVETLIPCKFHLKARRWTEAMEILDRFYSNHEDANYRTNRPLPLEGRP